jgi:hypothetical protein
MKIVFIDQDYRANVRSGEEIVALLLKYDNIVSYDNRSCSQETLAKRGRGAEIIFFKI